MKEIWKDVENYEGIYQVSNLGQVKSLDRWVNSSIKNNNKVMKKGKKLKKYVDSKTNYEYVKLSIYNKVKKSYIHRLVAQAFIPNPENKPQVNHIDGDKCNNRMNNLEYVSEKENMRHAFDNGLVKIKKGRQHHLAKNVYQYDLNDNLVKIWGSSMEAERTLKIAHSSINACCNGKKHYNTAGGYKWRYTNE